MFTGIITDVGTVIHAESTGAARRFRIETHYDMSDVDLGASIACAGPCLTVVDKGNGDKGLNWFDVDASTETLDRTTLGAWTKGTRINLERSLKLGSEMGGHLVTGHVDGIAIITEREDHDAFRKFVLEIDTDLAKFVAEKGSICLDGTSLTVNGTNANRFDIMLIPHSLEVTTWGERGVGDCLNVEVDLMARYAARLLEMRSDAQRA